MAVGSNVRRYVDSVTTGQLLDEESIDALPTGTPDGTDLIPYLGVTEEVAATADGTAGDPGTAGETITVGGKTYTITNAVAQVETATVVGTIESDGAGDAEVIVTGALVTGSPLTVPVAVANDDTASDVAGKIRTALDIAAITDNYTVSGAGADIILTADAAADNDATLNIAIDNDTSVGLTPAPTSVDTTAGAAAADPEADEIDAGATAAEYAANIAAKVTADTAATLCTCDDTDTALLFTANDPGAAGNDIPLSTTDANLTLDAEFAGGVDAGTVLKATTIADLATVIDGILNP